MHKFSPQMKVDTSIHFHKRSDKSSIDFVGQRVYEQLKEHGYNIKVKDMDVADETFVKPTDIGILYGLIRDLKKLNRYPCKIAGLVCESELTSYEVQLIKEANLTEIWVPSEFVAKFFIKAGFTELVRIVPHGVDDLAIVECNSDGLNGLMIFNSYSRLNNHVLRKNPFKAIEAVNLLNGSANVTLKLKTKHQKYYDKYDLKRVEFVESYIENLNKLYEECNFTLYPSEAEGFGLVGLESLVRGVPLIATKTGNDYLNDDVNYVKIELPVTAEKIKCAVSEMVINYQFYRKQAIKQRDSIYERNSWPSVGRMLNGIMEKVLCTIYGI
jgi:glycosyltransferase involved in cell wall biosynthesis